MLRPTRLFRKVLREWNIIRLIYIVHAMLQRSARVSSRRAEAVRVVHREDHHHIYQKYSH